MQEACHDAIGAPVAQHLRGGDRSGSGGRGNGGGGGGGGGHNGGLGSVVALFVRPLFEMMGE